MAYVMPTGSLIEVILRYRVNAQECMGVLHYLLDSGSSADGAASLAALLANINASGGLFGALIACQSEDVTYPPLRAQMIFGVRYIPLEVTAYASEGGIGEPCNQQQTAIAFTKRTESANRHGIGTFHMGGVPDTMIAGGRVAIAFESTLNTLAIKLGAPITVSGGLVFRPVIFNRASPAASLPVRGVTYRDTARTMRRRVVGRGI